MIWFVIVPVVLFLCLMIHLIQLRNEVIKTVVPGAKFVYKREDGNPFLDDEDYRYVVEVKNGWVRYKLGKNGAPIHTAKIGDFIAFKEFVENT